MRQLYAAEVTMVDVWLGRFLDRLENLGLAGNTLVVLVSDHGVLLGERGWVGKRYSEMHEELTHVPLAMRHPGRQGRGPDQQYFASTHDVGPTVLSALGVDEPRGMNGADLSPLFDGQAPRTKRELPDRRLQHLPERLRRPLAPDRRQPPRGAAPVRQEDRTPASATTSPTGTRRRCMSCGARSSTTPAATCRTSQERRRGL